MVQFVVISLEDETYPKDRLPAWFLTLPALYTLGNLNLLCLPLTALFCSCKCPGDAILKDYDLARDLHEKEVPVISGLLTPVEKDLLEILLKGKGSVIASPARGLEGCGFRRRGVKPSFKAIFYGEWELF
jgi:predicted Rossmann fold nucleotide-binding protein DprA/Smf involved in DNA uptake